MSNEDAATAVATSFSGATRAATSQKAVPSAPVAAVLVSSRTVLRSKCR